MRPVRSLVAAALLIGMSACAHAPDVPAGPPDYAPIAGEPAPANARYYADCLGQAAATGAYRRAADDGGDELILFTCTGAPARVFYEALGAWSAAIDSAFQHEGRTYRSTAKVQANMFGVDSCSAVEDADHRCVITFNAGDFLDE